MSILRRVVLGLLAALLLCICVGLYDGLHTVTYTLESDKASEPVRLVVLADLHSRYLGDGQTTLVREIEGAEPDALLLVGDIFDDILPDDGVVTLLEAIAGRWPSYYVSGNHEFSSGRMGEMKDTLGRYGVTVLEGESDTLPLGGGAITLVGVDDPLGGEDMAESLDRAFSGVDTDTYTVLLTHRPERIGLYLDYPVDLVAAGHTHGGQIRVPVLMNGLIAPDQGWLPQYGGGRYSFEETELVISRGLSNTLSVPRFYNRRELVVVEILPA